MVDLAAGRSGSWPILELGPPFLFDFLGLNDPALSVLDSGEQIQAELKLKDRIQSELP